VGVYKYTGKKGTVYFIDYYVNGKRFREQVGPKKKEAEEYLGKRLKEIRDGKFRETPVRPVFFDELADLYEKQAKGKRSYHNEKYYIKTVRGYFGERVISELTALDVEKFQTERKETPTRAKKVRSGATVNREMACLGAMLNKAVLWELIPKNPAAPVKDFKEPDGRNSFLSVEEAGRLLEECSNHLRPIVLCALETGMRKAEILGLRWREIRDGQIYLGGDRTKNGKPREIPVSDRLAEELQRMKAMQGGERITMLTNLVFSPPRERKRRSNGILQVVEGPMRDIRVAWEAAKKRAGIDPGFHFHDLRHTFASHQKMAGVDDYTLMAIMGHSDSKMMRRYAHLTPEHKRKAINSLPEWNSEKLGQKLVRNSDSVENVKRSVSSESIDYIGANNGG
jgi:integrase